MNILVTGIEGFVGSHLAEFLLSQTGVTVSGTVRSKDNIQNIQHLASAVRLFECDILERGQITSVITEAKPDAIIHLAAQAFVPASMAQPYDTFQTNINGALYILEQLRSQSPQTRIVIVSTGEVYGFADEKNLPITESTPLRPNNPYATSKACIDLLAQNYRQSFKMPVVVARPFNHAGPRQSPIFVCSDFAKQLIEIKKGTRPPKITVGNLKPLRDFIDVRDVVRAYWTLITNDMQSAVYNICATNPRSIESILEELIQLSGVNVSVEIDPARIRSYDVSKVYGTSQQLTIETGWKPEIQFSQTLKDVLDYWEAQRS